MKRLKIQGIAVEGMIFGLIGYLKHQEKTGMVVRPKLKCLSRKNQELRMLRLSALRIGKEERDEFSQIQLCFKSEE